MLNANQTFVYFYPEESVVVTPKNTKRVGVRVKSDAKSGFTAMVTVNLGNSQIDAPFVVYNGTKLKGAKNPKPTFAYRYRHWRDLSIGRSGNMVFHRNISLMTTSPSNTLTSFSVLSIQEIRLGFQWTWPLITAVGVFKSASRREPRRAVFFLVLSMAGLLLYFRSVTWFPIRNSRFLSRRPTGNRVLNSSWLRGPRLQTINSDTSRSRFKWIWWLILLRIKPRLLMVGSAHQVLLRRLSLFLVRILGCRERSSSRPALTHLPNSHSTKWWRISCSTALLGGSHEQMNCKRMRRQMFRHLQAPRRYLIINYF